MEKLNALLKSRKFWAAVVGLLVVVASAVNPDFPFSEEQVTNFIVVIASYIFGVAIEARSK